MKPSILIALLVGGSLAAAGVTQAQKPYKGAPTTVGTGLHGVAAPLSFGPRDWRTVDPDNLLVIDTNKGRVLVELAPLVAPAHVQQIKTLAHQHFYDGQTFFRVIDQFMDQTGDPQNLGKEGGSSLPNLKAEFTFRRGPEMPFVPVAQPGGAVTGFIGSMPVESQADALMAMTADHKVSAWTQFCTGVAGMARDEKEDSANSQFFLMRHDYPSLDKRYTGWGRVVAGEDVVRAIKTGEPAPPPQDHMTQVRLASDLPASERPKVRVLDPASAGFRALLERTREAKGADFSVCDIDLPHQVS